MPAERAQPYVPGFADGIPAAADRVLVEKPVEVGLVVPHGEQRRASEVGAGSGVVPSARPHQPPEGEPVDAGQARSVEAETGERERCLPRRLGDQMEGRDASHVSDMLSPMDAISDFASTPVDVLVVVVVGYLLGSIPIANLVAARRSAVDLRDVGDRNPGFWNARETMGRMAAVPVFVGDVAKGVVAAGLGVAPRR